MTVLALWMALTAPMALASITFYTDRSAWLAAVTGVTTDTFDCAGCSFVFLGSGAAARGTTTFTNSGGAIFLIGSFYSPFTVSGDDFFQSENQDLSVHFGTPVRAVGFDFNSNFSNPNTMSLAIGPDTTSQVLPLGTGGFLGAVSTADFSDIQITSSYIVQIDNLSIGAAAPEPATLALLGLGLAGLGFSRRKQ